MENLPALNLKNLDKSEWKSYRFDQIVKNISERVDPNNTDLEVYVGLEHIDSESIHLKRSGTPDDVDGQKLRFYPGDVIFGRRRAYQRKAAVATTHGFCSAHALVLRANPEIIDSQLFPFFMHSDAFMHRAVDISVGSLSPTINWGTLKSQQFLIPNKEQQKSIFKILWALDKVIEQEEELLRSIYISRKTYINSVLYKYETGIESALPNGFSVKKLEDVAEISGGSTPSRTNPEFWGGDIPWLTPTDVTKNEDIHLSTTKERITKDGLKSISNRIYPPGSILYCSRATIGYAIINDVAMATNQGFTNFICKSSINNYFLYFLLQHITPELTRLAGGSTFLEIPKSSVKSFKVVIPEEFLQKKIAKKIVEYENTIKTIKLKICKSKALQDSLINHIF
ncbi:restriction endonuclease subunit S [Methylotenera sp.]|uniref:restriction endonuclease subunit S n=1 Tax=Methylotenera sp. TaxID=2051956 RepID=UPI002ED9DDBF